MFGDLLGFVGEYLNQEYLEFLCMHTTSIANRYSLMFSDTCL